MLLSTGFTPNWSSVPEELKQRGSPHPRVVVRNFFAHSTWMGRLGVPPLDAYPVPGGDDVVTRPQELKAGEPFRLVDFHREAPVEDFEQAWRDVLTAPPRRTSTADLLAKLRTLVRRSEAVRRRGRRAAALPRSRRTEKGRRSRQPQH